MRKYFSIKNQKLTLRKQLEGIPMPMQAVEGAINFIKLYALYSDEPTWIFKDGWRFGYSRNLNSNNPTLAEMQLIVPALKKVPHISSRSAMVPPKLVMFLTETGITEDVAVQWLINDVSRIALDLTTKDGTWETLSGESIFAKLDVARQRSLVVLAHFIGVDPIIDNRILLTLGTDLYKISAAMVRALLIEYFPSDSSWHDVIVNLICEDIEYGDTKDRPREYHVCI